jgi:hypothetical protein
MPSTAHWGQRSYTSQRQNGVQQRHLLKEGALPDLGGHVIIGEANPDGGGPSHVLKGFERLATPT